MSTSTEDQLAGFGECTWEDLVALDEALAKMNTTEAEHQAARRAVGLVMGAMMKKGAQRIRIAERAGVNAQTVSFMVNGRPSRSEVRKRNGKND
jgi:hypothetical protein